MSLANVAYNPALTWADPSVRELEDQALVPMFGTDPVELGMNGQEEKFLSIVRRDSLYARLFPRAFPGSGAPVTMPNVVRAIAAFERTIISMGSPYDRYRYGGEANAISESAKRGETFFFSGQRGSCFQCHSGWNFNGELRYEGRLDAKAAFFNTGLYNVAGQYSYPAPNTGIHHATNKPGDVGKFRVPTLRNVAVTAPYMHDGSAKTLSDVIDHYAAGGRTITSGPYAGVGRDNPNKAPNVHGFSVTADEKNDLIAFLESLTDSAFLANPALSDPFVTLRGRAPHR
jgi:cytochrome c peroxidase